MGYRTLGLPLTSPLHYRLRHTSKSDRSATNPYWKLLFSEKTPTRFSSDQYQTITDIDKMLQSCNYYDHPNYEMVHEFLKGVMTKSKIDKWAQLKKPVLPEKQSEPKKAKPKAVPRRRDDRRNDYSRCKEMSREDSINMDSMKKEVSAASAVDSKKGSLKK
ncbi:hypothetical protein B9Z55_013211 [Caenorhabditis nigoni]|nr:hypothetical protein B9Z55_013211 [Caenorhabditis nigoni]